MAQDRRHPMSEHMLISAVRYAVGRRTYITGVTVGEVQRLWDDLSPWCRHVILADVAAADSLGDALIDQPLWRSLLERKTP